MSIESEMPSNHLILCCPLFLLPPIPPSIRVFSNELTLCMRWPKYWSFSFSISPSNEYAELISFKIDWLDLLEVQGTFKGFLQHHSSKASILWRSALFTELCFHHPIIFWNIGLMLKLKLQYFGHLMWRTDSLEKTLMLGKTEGRRRRGRQVEMVG